jgi:hypothetical protein
MRKYLVGYTFWYHGQAQLRRTFHESDGELTEADILELEVEITADPRAGVPDGSAARVLFVSELAADREKPAPPANNKTGCAVLLALVAVPLLAGVAAAWVG